LKEICEVLEMNEIGRAAVIEKVTKAGLWFYRQYCECGFEKLGAAVEDLPQLKNSICPRCGAVLRAEEYLIDARTEDEAK